MYSWWSSHILYLLNDWIYSIWHFHNLMSKNEMYDFLTPLVFAVIRWYTPEVLGCGWYSSIICSCYSKFQWYFDFLSMISEKFIDNITTIWWRQTIPVSVLHRSHDSLYTEPEGSDMKSLCFILRSLTSDDIKLSPLKIFLVNNSIVCWK